MLNRVYLIAGCVCGLVLAFALCGGPKLIASAKAELNAQPQTLQQMVDAAQR